MDIEVTKPQQGKFIVRSLAHWTKRAKSGKSAVVKFLIQFGLSFQAIIIGSLNIQEVPDLCRELAIHWKQVGQYLTKYAPRQQGQGVHTRVSLIF